jgi:ribosomal protein S18 acetylase RimI-like enzyme
MRGLPDRPGVEWASSPRDEDLQSLIATALSASLDPRDRATVAGQGATATAQAMLADAAAGKAYRCEREWWSLIRIEGEPAGFVLPVVFTGAERNGVDEGTIYHIGVVPKWRGRGLGGLLLARGANVLLAHGVWQISADTAAENGPMIRIFEHQNWIRQPEITVGLHPLPGVG